MKIKRSNEVEDIRTAVIYGFNYFIPELPDPKSEKYLKDLEVLTQRLVSNGFIDILRSDEGSFVSTRTLYYGNTERFNDIDFAEYDFNAILEDLKFNNKGLINYFDKETIDLFGDNNESRNSVETLAEMEAAVFPTISENTATKNNVEYFGSMKISTTQVYLFNLDPGQYKIELYENVVSGNNTKVPGFLDSDYCDLLGIEKTNTPVVTIYLGPEDFYANNPDYMYCQDVYGRKGDPLLENRETEISPLEYGKKYDEIYAGKSVWFTLSSDNSIKELNLSYNAWEKSEDANIYKRKFNLRNDDFYEIIRSSSPSYLKELDYQSGYLDRRNGKLLGNQVLFPNINNPSQSNCPILSRKLSNLGQDQFNTPGKYPYSDYVYGKVYNSGEVYKKGCDYYMVRDGSLKQIYIKHNPEVEYNIGDLVLSKTSELYEVVKKGNRGYFPGLSPHWVLRDKTLDLFTTRVSIVQDPLDGGKISPNKQITIVNENKTEDITFEVSPEIGYEFGTVLTVKDDSTVLELDPDDYIVIDSVDESNYFKLVTIKRSGWESILKGDDKKRIIFKFNPIHSTIVLTYYIKGMELSTEIPVEGLEDEPRLIPQGNSYFVALGAINKNGNRYAKKEDIIRELSELMINDNVLLEFVLIDDVHSVGVSRFIDGSIIKESSGTITKDNFTISDKVSTLESWEYIKDEILKNVQVLKYPIEQLDFNKLSINLGITNKLFITVSSYDGFEVSDINQEIEYNTETSLQFYGTYRDNLDYITVNNKIIEGIGMGTLTFDTGETIRYSLSKLNSMYTLKLFNVVTDIDIKLFEK